MGPKLAVDVLDHDIDLVGISYWIGKARAELESDGYVSDSNRSLIRSTIGYDWSRLFAKGIDAQEIDPEFVNRDELLSRQEDPALRQVWETARGFLRKGDPDWIFVLTDAAGCVLWREGDPRILTETAAYGFDQGALYAADGIGTGGIKLIVNPPGEPLGLVQVCGPEHWKRGQRRWACTALSVRHPNTGKPLAVANITGPWQGWRSHSLRDLTTLVRDIHRVLSDPILLELATIRDKAQRWLYSGGLTLAVTSHGLVADSHEWNPRGRDRIVLPNPEEIQPGPVFLPEIGWCELTSLDDGWLVRRPADQPDQPTVRVVLDLRDTQPRIRLGWLGGHWERPLQRRLANVLKVLAQSGRSELTNDMMLATLPGTVSRNNVGNLKSMTLKEFGGLLAPGSFRFADYVAVEILQPE